MCAASEHSFSETNRTESTGDEVRLYQVLRKLGQLTERCGSRLSVEFGILGIQARQSEYLRIIDQHPMLTSSRFAEILQITKPSVTEIVNKLIHEGLVLKKRCTNDGRVFYIELTEKGKNASRINDLRDQKLAGNLCRNLNSSEIETLAQLIRKATD